MPQPPFVLIAQAPASVAQQVIEKLNASFGVSVSAEHLIALDGIPEWKALSEEERDSIIVGVANLAKFMADVSAKPGGKKAVKLAVKGARRAK